MQGTLNVEKAYVDHDNLIKYPLKSLLILTNISVIPIQFTTSFTLMSVDDFGLKMSNSMHDLLLCHMSKRFNQN